MAVEAREVVFRGRVQGVGFRYATHEIARRFSVTGFVQNQADRSVLLVAEGEAAELDAFVAAIEERMSGHIKSVDRHARRPEGMTGFVIRG